MAELPDQLLIEFAKPIVFNGKTVESITLEEPTIGQIEQAQKAARGLDNSLAFVRELIVLVSNQPSTIISQMKIRDVNTASAYLMGFIEPSRPISET